MSTYRAWDQNEYPWPPPDGWYQGSDGLWWPEGHGPGPGASPGAGGPAAPAAPYSEPTPSGWGGPADPAPPSQGWDTPPPAAGQMPYGGASSAPAPGGWEQHPGAYGAPGQGGAGGPAPSSGSGQSRSTMIIAAVAGVVVVVMLVIVAVLVLGGDDDDSAASSTGPGSQSQPHRQGDLVSLRFNDPDSSQATEWKLTITAPPTDVTAQAPGSVDSDKILVAASADIQYVTGDGSGDLDDLEFDAVDRDGRRYDSTDCPAGTALDELDGDLAAGSSRSGQLCWEIPADRLSGLLLELKVKDISGSVYIAVN